MGVSFYAIVLPIEKIIDFLQWKEDMLVTNDFGERVWLGPCYDEDGKRIGITDCCFEDDPCPHHNTENQVRGISQ